MIIKDETSEGVQDTLEKLSQRLQEKGVECSMLSSEFLIVKDCFLQRNMFRWHLKCRAQWLLLFNGAASDVRRQDNINHFDGLVDEDMYMVEDFLIRYSQYFEKYE